MTFIVGRGVRVEVSKTEGTAKTVTAVTNADPAVASSVAHGLAAKTVGYFDEDTVTGMLNLAGQAVQINPVTTDGFTLYDVDATDYPVYTGGTFVPITQWSTLAASTDVTMGGGDADRQETTVLLDDIRKYENGLLADQTVQISLRALTLSDEALTIIKKAARRNLLLVFRITLKDGNKRVFRGTPSLPGENIPLGAIGTGSLSVTIKGFINEGVA